MNATGSSKCSNADRVAFEPLPFGLVAADILKPGDPFAIGLEPMAPQWLIAANSGEEQTC